MLLPFCHQTSCLNLQWEPFFQASEVHKTHQPDGKDVILKHPGWLEKETDKFVTIFTVRGNTLTDFFIWTCSIILFYFARNHAIKIILWPQRYCWWFRSPVRNHLVCKQDKLPTSTGDAGFLNHQQDLLRRFLVSDPWDSEGLWVSYMTDPWDEWYRFTYHLPLSNIKINHSCRQIYLTSPMDPMGVGKLSYGFGTDSELITYPLWMNIAPAWKLWDDVAIFLGWILASRRHMKWEGVLKGGLQKVMKKPPIQTHSHRIHGTGIHLP